MSRPSSPLHKPTPNHPAHRLLARAHSPTTAESLFVSKIKQKPLLLQPTTIASAAGASASHESNDKRALRRHIRLRKKQYYLQHRRPRPLSAKEKRRLGVHDLKKGEIRYAIYEGLHRIWVGYMWEVLGITSSSSSGTTTTGKGGGANVVERNITAQGHGSLLASADFHGAKIEVVKCACAGRVGTKGIVVRDTKFTFVVVTEGDEVRTLPKRGTVFRYEVPLPLPGEEEDGLEVLKAETSCGGEEEGRRRPERRTLVFELQGNQFETRPADRANKKFKWSVKEYL